ncbi:MAG: alpha/beta hydrolase [Microbacteriaceae bacterium]|jgi:non-heme chloroperoxidase|nr:alpha/beta hydrolase [Microbacteriaceae bacterium]
MAPFTVREREQIARANASGRRPVVFVHGLWLLADSWDRWREFFEEQGYVTLAPAWPREPETVEEAVGTPRVAAGAGIDEVVAHMLAVVEALSAAPAVVGHSFGALLAQRVAGEGVASVTVAIASVPFRGVTHVPLAMVRNAASVVGEAVTGRSVAPSFERFVAEWANAVPENEASELFHTFIVPASGVPLLQAVTANVNPFSGARVDTRNHERGPLLLIAGTEDVIATPAVQNAIFALQGANPSLTELVEIPGRGHSLTIDHGWRGVAEIALAFVRERATRPPV